MKKWMLATWMCTAVLFFGCGDDEPVGAHTGGTGGKASGGTGAGGSGGSGGVSGGAGGTSGTGAVAGAGGSAGGDAAVAARLLVAGTDFATQTEVATIDVASGTVSGSATFSDGDAVPAAAAGTAFVLERTLAKVDVLGSDGKVAKTIDVGKSALGESGTGSSNPVNVAVANGKAYVVLGAANKLAVVDLTAGSVTKAIDLSAYQDGGDADGAVDAVGAVLVSAPSRVYFVLGRIDRTTIQSPNFELACPTTKALVLAVDTSTDTLADLNGAASGDGIELALTNPVDLAFDPGQGKLLALSAGCFQAGEAGSTRVGAGVESIQVSSGVVSTVYASLTQDYLARLLPLGGPIALVDTFDPSFTERWYGLKYGDATFGPELAGVPAAPSVENSSALLGIKIATTDGGANVDIVRYTVANQQSATVASNPWTSGVTNAAGTALVQ